MPMIRFPTSALAVSVTKGRIVQDTLDSNCLFVSRHGRLGE